MKDYANNYRRFTAYNPSEKRMMTVVMPDFDSSAEFAKKLRDKGYKVPLCIGWATDEETANALLYEENCAAGLL